MTIQETITQICGTKFEDAEVMIYGRSKCDYEKVAAYLDGKIKRVFNYKVGLDDERSPTYAPDIKRLESRMTAVNPGSQQVGRFCKNGLTTILFENYKRAKEGLPLIHVIFCNEMDGVENLDPAAATKGHKDAQDITCKELRRVWKHINDPLLPEEIREIAKKTFFSVRVTKSIDASEANQSVEKQRVEYNLSLVPSIWENPVFDAGCKARAKNKKNPDYHTGFRETIVAMVKGYHADKARAASNATKHSIVPEIEERDEFGDAFLDNNNEQLSEENLFAFTPPSSLLTKSSSDASTSNLFWNDDESTSPSNRLSSVSPSSDLFLDEDLFGSTSPSNRSSSASPSSDLFLDEDLFGSTSPSNKSLPASPSSSLFSDDDDLFK